MGANAAGIKAHMLLLILHLFSQTVLMTVNMDRPFHLSVEKSF